MVGGVDAERGQHPWLVAMIVAKTRQPYCIGALINDRVVLTGAHCFKGRFRKANNTEVLLNAHVLDPMPNVHIIKGKVDYQEYDDAKLVELDRGNNSYRYQVQKIIIHPLFDPILGDYDSALLILNSPVRFKEYCPICLPPLSKNGAPDMYTGKRAEFVGWGLTHTKAYETNTHLSKIRVNINSPEECLERYGESIPDLRRVICAAHPRFTQDSCYGDSGGPLAVEVKGVWYNVGISSWGEHCAKENEPGIYYRTTSTNQWIHYESNMVGAVWCENAEYLYPYYL